jgi:hypothetical protein
MTLLRDGLDRPAPTQSSTRHVQRATTRRRLGLAGREVLLVAALFGLYKYGRALVVGERAEAIHHAESVRRFEAFLHLPSEAALQGAVGSVGSGMSSAIAGAQVRPSRPTKAKTAPKTVNCLPLLTLPLRSPT